MLHVAISLVGILAGFVVLYGMFGSRRLPNWTAVFLGSAILSDVTGYLFPSDHILPSHIIGEISLAILAVGLLALYRYRLAGSWRWIYIACSVACRLS